jgi:hypothetical protein
MARPDWYSGTTIIEVALARNKDALRSSKSPMPPCPEQAAGCYCGGRIGKSLASGVGGRGKQLSQRSSQDRTVEELQHVAHAFPVPLCHQLDRPAPPKRH